MVFSGRVRVGGGRFCFFPPSLSLSYPCSQTFLTPRAINQDRFKVDKGKPKPRKGMNLSARAGDRYEGGKKLPYNQSVAVQQ